ncbi:uridine kinase family protein [Trueperella pecoris]|uniref:uridine kinase family protein n=1 Tax=Trueperella pecoris TaxID=2733571 RepID=UPI001ABEA2E2|nr:hypothetical protein [Trueperella pecoris]QTG74632.1 hypothetical protein J4179_05130 [Trueperella pecoris]
MNGHLSNIAIADICDALLALPAPALVGIDGRSGAGKTTLANALAARLEAAGRRVSTVEVEAYIGGWGSLVDHIGKLARMAGELSQRGSTQATPWDWAKEHWAEPVRIPRAGQADVVILVGCGSTSASVRPYLDLTVWLEADAELRLKRVRARDPYDWSEHWPGWAAQEEALLAEFPSNEKATFTLLSEA